MLWVAEYGRLRKGLSNKQLHGGNVELCADDFEALCSLEDERFDEDQNPIFKHSIRSGEEYLSTSQHVGVIRTNSGCQIEILPKISKVTDPDRVRQILIDMLVAMPDSPYKEGLKAHVAARRMSLFELLIRQFLDHVGEIIRRGIARSYVQQEGNLFFLRGKLRLNEQIKRNASVRTRVFCEFDEFEVNRPINRLLRGALEIVSRVTQDTESQQRSREFLFWFDAIPATNDPASDFRSVRHDRLIQHYQPAMPICRLILEGLNPLPTSGDRSVLSMLFDMNRVFENYVAVKLNSQFPGWKVRTQVSGKSLVANHAGKSSFRLEPDLEFTQGATQVIGDTKWKLIDQNARSDHYKILQSDVYQMFAYAQKYLASQKQKRIILIYPFHDDFRRPLEPFWFRERDEVLYVLPFDLELGQLILPEKFFLSDFDAIDEISTPAKSIA